MDDLTGEFINETSESLAALERALGEHASTPMTRDGWDTAYRLMHTIKGTCGFLGFTQMEAVADRSERLLTHARDHAVSPDAAQLAEIRGAMAQISSMMEYLAEHGSEPKQAPAAPAPEAPRVDLKQVNEQIHRPVETATLPPMDTSSRNALATRAEAPAEQIGFATLATLVSLRNDLKDMARGRADARIATAAATLDALIEQMKQKLMPRPKDEPKGPRVVGVLMVECAGQRFAVPQSAIREIARVDTVERLAHLPDGAMLSLHGSWVPRVSLAARLGQGASAQEAYAAILEINAARVALCVEHVGELEELVVQQVPTMLRSKKLYGGAAILGDGTPCLVLDAAALLEQQPTITKRVAPSPVPAPVVVEPFAEPELPPIIPAAKPTPFLLFADGSSQPKAIPLIDVARVEHVQAEDVRDGADGYEFTCRGSVLQLRVLPGSVLPKQGDFPLIMLLNAPATGLVAHRMHGIVDTEVTLPAVAAQASTITRMVIDGALTDIVNPAYYVDGEVAHG